MNKNIFTTAFSLAAAMLLCSTAVLASDGVVPWYGKGDVIWIAKDNVGAQTVDGEKFNRGNSSANGLINIPSRASNWTTVNKKEVRKSEAVFATWVNADGGDDKGQRKALYVKVDACVFANGPFYVEWQVSKDYFRAKLMPAEDQVAKNGAYVFWLKGDANQVWFTAPTLCYCAPEWKLAYDATCTEDGLYEFVCPDCGTVYEEAVIPATGHNWSDWEVVYEAVCDTDGWEVRYCLNCGEEEWQVIPAPGCTCPTGPVGPELGDGWSTKGGELSIPLSLPNGSSHGTVLVRVNDDQLNGTAKGNSYNTNATAVTIDLWVFSEGINNVLIEVKETFKGNTLYPAQVLYITVIVSDGEVVYADFDEENWGL